MTAESETVKGLTAGILADRAFDRLPILADALEDADGESDRTRGMRAGDGAALVALVEHLGGEVTLTCRPEVERIEDNACSHDDCDTCHWWIRDQLAAGNEWAWCEATVTVLLPDGAHGQECLGCCSYQSEADFRAPGGYFGQMVEEALEVALKYREVRGNWGGRPTLRYSEWVAAFAAEFLRRCYPRATAAGLTAEVILPRPGTVSYWSLGRTPEEAVDDEVSKYGLADHDNPPASPGRPT